MSEISVEFKSYRKSIVQNLRTAHMHYRAFKFIRRSIPEFRKIINRSNYFWSLVLDAHLETTQISLSRSFDQRQDAISLKSWLHIIQDNHSDLLESTSEKMENFHTHRLEEKEIIKDLETVSMENELVKKLIIQRNNVFAHTSKKTNSDDITENYPLTYSSYDELMSQGERILNRYSILHDGVNYSMGSFESEDYRLVLDDLQNASILRDKI